jgi:sigma-E factor negative regulatory protein RseA
MNEELDSQLSAMFDGELPPAQCELLARRLSRDEQLKARWGRYAAIGATIRAEGGARLDAGLARRVSAAISKEPSLLARQTTRRAARSGFGWVRPVAGLGVAAGVAALSILWMRSQAPGDETTIVAQTVTPLATPKITNVANPGDSGSSYVVPPQSAQHRMVVPSTQFANYVVAHSEFSSPVTRRNLLSALMAGESGTAGTSAGSEEPSEDANDDAKSAQ